MMTTADRNAFAVKDRGQIMRVDADRLEGDDRPFVMGLADDSDAVQFSQTTCRGARLLRALQHVGRSGCADRRRRRGAEGVWLMDDNLRELYQEIILDHSRHPRHFGALGAANHVAEGHNPLCGDRVKVYLQVDDKGRIADVSFEGRGCAISVASASLMTEMLKGRTIEDAEALMGGFLDMVKGENVGGLKGDDRELLEVMAGVSAFPMRVKCATLAWHAMKAALDNEGVARTE